MYSSCCKVSQESFIIQIFDLAEICDLTEIFDLTKDKIKGDILYWCHLVLLYMLCKIASKRAL